MIEAMKLALEALKELVAQTENSFFSIKHDHVALQNSRSAIAKLNQAIEQAEKQEVPYVLVERDGSGKTVISSISPEALGHVKQYPKCNPHPKAPHGFDRNASHGLDRHVCECESWDAYDAGIEEGMKRERALWEKAENARELGLDYEPVPWIENMTIDSTNELSKPTTPVQEPVADSAFEKWWDEEGSAAPKHRLDCEEHCYQIAKIAWSNGAYKAQESYPPAAPVQEPYGWVSQHTVKGPYEWQFNKELSGVYRDNAISILPVYTTPPAQQEPVVWMYQDKSTHEVRFQKHMRGFVDHGATYETPLYTTPPQRKPLPPQSPCEMTQAEGKMFKLGWLECEAAHGIKEKNT